MDHEGKGEDTQQNLINIEKHNLDSRTIQIPLLRDRRLSLPNFCNRQPSLFNVYKISVNTPF